METMLLPIMTAIAVPSILRSCRTNYFSNNCYYSQTKYILECERKSKRLGVAYELVKNVDNAAQNLNDFEQALKILNVSREEYQKAKELLEPELKQCDSNQKTESKKQNRELRKFHGDTVLEVLISYMYETLPEERRTFSELMEIVNSLLKEDSIITFNLLINDWEEKMKKESEALKLFKKFTNNISMMHKDAREIMINSALITINCHIQRFLYTSHSSTIEEEIKVLRKKIEEKDLSFVDQFEFEIVEIIEETIKKMKLESEEK